MFFIKRKWGSGNTFIGRHLLGDVFWNRLIRSSGSSPSQTLSLILSLCKNAMSSAIRRANSSWPAEALKTVVSQDIVFLSLPLPIFTLKLSSHSFFRTHPSRYHLFQQINLFTANLERQFRGVPLLLCITIYKKCDSQLAHPYFHLLLIKRSLHSETTSWILRGFYFAPESIAAKLTIFFPSHIVRVQDDPYKHFKAVLEFFFSIYFKSIFQEAPSTNWIFPRGILKYNNLSVLEITIHLYMFILILTTSSGPAWGSRSYSRLKFHIDILSPIHNSSTMSGTSTPSGIHDDSFSSNYKCKIALTYTFGLNKGSQYAKMLKLCVRVCVVINPITEATPMKFFNSETAITEFQVVIKQIVNERMPTFQFSFPSAVLHWFYTGVIKDIVISPSIYRDLFFTSYSTESLTGGRPTPSMRNLEGIVIPLSIYRDLFFTTYSTESLAGGRPTPSMRSLEDNNKIFCKLYVMYTFNTGSFHSETMAPTIQVMMQPLVMTFLTKNSYYISNICLNYKHDLEFKSKKCFLYILYIISRCKDSSYFESRNLSCSHAGVTNYFSVVRTMIKIGKLSARKYDREAPPFFRENPWQPKLINFSYEAKQGYGINGDSDSMGTIHTESCHNTSIQHRLKPGQINYLDYARKSKNMLKNCSFSLTLHRSISKMPANKRNRDPRVRAYDPVQEAQIPTSNLTWERQAGNAPGKTIKRSNNFKIPRTSRQEPATMMPNPPYEALNLTYASSSKTRPRAATGSKRHADTEKQRGAGAKKAHLEWLHTRAIPDLDREIMKTNALVDNILAEQTELDTQMLAIRAMGGEVAYNIAYKAHDGLRRAITKRLQDAKRKRAKQFESIRSMRTMMRTLVAEIDDNADNRHHILRSRHSSIGSHKSTGKIFNPLETHLKTHPYIPTGPHPRSLLRPEINKDSNPNLHFPDVQALSSCPHPTPPTTPQAGRCVWLFNHSQADNNVSLTTNRSPSIALPAEYDTSPIFSNDDEDDFQLDTILSPISSPSGGNPGRGQALLPLTHGLDLQEGYKYVMHSNLTCRYLAYRKGKDSCQIGSCASFSLHDHTHGKTQYKRNNDFIPVTSLQTTSAEITSYIPRHLHSYHSEYVSSNPLAISSTRTNCQLDNTSISMDKYILMRGGIYDITNCRYTTPPHPDVESQYTPATSPQCDLLQAAAIAAGLADDDESTTYSIDSPQTSAPSSPPSPPTTPISLPNRHLLVPSTNHSMPKNKNTGASGDTPTKSPRKNGNLTLHIYKNKSKAATNTINGIKITYLLTAANPDDDILDMSGIQEGNGSDHSSDLDSTIQGDQPPSGSGDVPPTGQPQQGTGGKTYGPRQSTPNQDTPRSSHPEDESEKASDDDTSSESDDDEQEEEEMDAESLAERDLQKDLSKVREAVSLAGGLASNKPDFEKQKDREGQHVEVVEEWVDLTEETFDDLPERPAENTLRRISLKELLPPATSVPVPLDMELDGEELTFVANQRIEFLVLMRKDGNDKTSWGFPNEAQLLKMYNHVRNVADHDLIMDVCLWCRVDPKTGIASIMLSTIHLPLFKRIRHEIRVYAGFPGFRCETYSKITFMQKYGVTLYVPKEVAGMNEKRLFKTLFRKYRHLNVRFLILTRTTFTKDHPDKPPHKRSRIGDRILLLDGPALYEVLKTEPEDKKYFLNDGFSVTLRGGIRSTGPTSLFASSFASQVISGLPSETMKQAENRA